MKHLVFDCNNLSHRAWHIMAALGHKGKPTGVLFGVLRDIRFIQDVLNIRDVIFTFDHKKQIRKTIYPDYKANRDRTGKEALYRQIDELREYVLPTLGFKNILHLEGYEADDLIAFCVTSNPKDRFVIVSTDTDLWQLITHKVTIWNPITKYELTKDRFIAEHGFEPKKWLRVKTLMGDKGDNIPGIPNVGEATAVKIMKAEQQPEEHTNHWRELAEKNSHITSLNNRLMKLPSPLLETPRCCVDLMEDDAGRSRETWGKICQQYGLHSLMNKPPL